MVADIKSAQDNVKWFMFPSTCYWRLSCPVGAIKPLWKRRALWKLASQAKEETMRKTWWKYDMLISCTNVRNVTVCTDTHRCVVSSAAIFYSLLGLLNCIFYVCPHSFPLLCFHCFWFLGDISASYFEFLFFLAFFTQVLLWTHIENRH